MSGFVGGKAAAEVVGMREKRTENAGMRSIFILSNNGTTGEYVSDLK